ncbi:uncharacterized PE-PGRS family protein PE_PGRS36-like [Corticium candelabrum]|uniref:uncharacterized PE-PGRS family protein PE_PGRS36-like n=1 Tax=Corticium candelabrum TaxID=121492 RepID=UPI002E26F0F1|nr:uncharacterized PE-PGRS family protein PE_PGRS36-like [Corticium candelabrum]
MVIQMQGQNAGQYEFTRVQKVTRSIIYLIHPLVHTYSSSSNARAQIVRVPNYSKFTITGNGKLTALNWNGTSGGIIAIRARTFTIDLGGTIDTNGKGFRGGPEKKCCYYWIGVTGESWKEIGFPNNYQTSNNAGGGGSSYCQCREIAGSGSYGSVGLPPLGKSCSGSGHGQPGAIYGSPNLTQLFLGSGGGGGCDSSTTSCAAYSGSNGGGIIYITAGTATLHGTLTSAGNRRLEPKNTCVKTVGGPGSGGTIYLQATTLNLDDTRVFNVSGGDRVLVYNNLFSGKGGNGRVRVDYDTMNGYSHLTASAKSIETSFPGVGFWGRVPPG